MKVRKILFAVLVLMASGSFVLAQRPGDCPPPDGRHKHDPEFMQKARAERAEYIVSRLGLNDEESQVFLTVNDEVEEAKQLCMSQRHNLYKELCEAVEGGDENEIAGALSAYTQALEAMDRARKEGDEKMAKILSPVQMAIFVIADEEFRRSKINKLNGKSGGRPEGRPEGRPDGRGRGNGGQGRPSGGPWR